MTAEAFKAAAIGHSAIPPDAREDGSVSSYGRRVKAAASAKETGWGQDCPRIAPDSLAETVGVLMLIALFVALAVLA